MHSLVFPFTGSLIDTGKRIVVVYKLIALAPKTPATADATAITTFRIISHTDFFIAIIYLLSRSLNSLVYSVFLPYFPPEKAYDSPAWRNNAPRSN